MLPGKDGFTVAAELRAAEQFLPILMLTARGRPEDVLRGFESGADDYLPKPFELSVLLARVRGLLRRREWFHREAGGQEAAGGSAAARERPPDTGAAADTFTFDGKTIDFAALELRTAGRTLRLTLMEAEL